MKKPTYYLCLLFLGIWIGSAAQPKIVINQKVINGDSANQVEYYLTDLPLLDTIEGSDHKPNYHVMWVFGDGESDTTFVSYNEITNGTSAPNVHTFPATGSETSYKMAAYLTDRYGDEPPPPQQLVTNRDIRIRYSNPQTFLCPARVPPQDSIEVEFNFNPSAGHYLVVAVSYKLRANETTTGAIHLFYNGRVLKGGGTKEWEEAFDCNPGGGHDLVPFYGTGSYVHKSAAAFDESEGGNTDFGSYYTDVVSFTFPQNVQVGVHNIQNGAPSEGRIFFAFEPDPSLNPPDTFRFLAVYTKDFGTGLDVQNIDPGNNLSPAAGHTTLKGRQIKDADLVEVEMLAARDPIRIFVRDVTPCGDSCGLFKVDFTMIYGYLSNNGGSFKEVNHVQKSLDEDFFCFPDKDALNSMNKSSKSFRKLQYREFTKDIQFELKGVNIRPSLPGPDGWPIDPASLDTIHYSFLTNFSGLVKLSKNRCINMGCTSPPDGGSYECGINVALEGPVKNKVKSLIKKVEQGEIPLIVDRNYCAGCNQCIGPTFVANVIEPFGNLAFIPWVIIALSILMLVAIVYYLFGRLGMARTFFNKYLGPPYKK